MNPSSLEQTLKSSFAPRIPPSGSGSANGRAAKKPAFAPPVRRGTNRLTVEGSLFIVLTLLIGMAAVNSGHNLLYLVFSVMLAMLLISGNLARTNLHKLSIQRKYPAEFYSGQEVPAHLEVRNSKRFFSSYGIRFQDFAISENSDRIGEPPVKSSAFVACIRPAHAAQCATRLLMPRRGVYRLVSVQTISRYPFGFFQRTRRVDVVGHLLVFPKLAPQHLVTPHLAFIHGDREADRKGMGSGLYGVRDYASGDPARLIHWKHSAKGMGLKLKEFEEERAQSFRIMLDLRCVGVPSEELREQIEKAVSVTATLARFFLQKSASVSLWTTYGRVPAGYGRNQLQRVLRALARVAPQSWETEIPMIDDEPVETATYWVVFQDPDVRPSGIGRGFRRPPMTRIVDVRGIDLSDRHAALNPAPKAVFESGPNGH